MKPILSNEISIKEFNEYYYLKEELIDFCHNEGLKSTGNKDDLERRIIKHLKNCKTNNTMNRKFFEDSKDSGFKFNVNNNIWFKNHPNTSYENAYKVFHGIHDVISRLVNN